MFRNYLKHAIKTIISQGHQSIISALGLSVALSCSIVILLYVRYELSYDKFHNDANEIYRIITERKNGSGYMGINTSAVTPAPLKEAVLNDIPGTAKSTKCKVIAHTLEYNSALFTERGFLYADTDFMKIFSFPVISGNTEDLNEPFTLFITREMAAKYFGSEEPLGKVIKADNKYLFTVRGVIENIPDNSHLKFGFLTGFETYYSIKGGREKVEIWNNLSYITYIKLEKNVNPEDISVLLGKLPEKYMPDEPFFKGMQWILISLNKIHLGRIANFEPGNIVDIRYIYLIVSVGIFVLLIACFNYMNMATARAYGRGREAGILKVSGSSRTELIIQFVSESVIISFGGLMIALLIIWLCLPAFSTFIKKPLVFKMIFEYSVLLKIIILTVLAGVLSGIYPAVHLSSIGPLQLINEDFRKLAGRGKSGRIRDLLIIMQYIISIVALVCTFTVLKQLNLIRKTDLGFARKNVLTVFVRDPAIRSNPSVLMNELRANPNIVDVTVSSDLPNLITSSSYCLWEGKPEETSMSVFRVGIGTSFIDFYKLKIIKGRGFQKDFSADSANSYIINETAARMIGWDDPVGKNFGFKQNAMGNIIGVIKDFNFQSLHLPVEPLAISLAGGRDFPETSYISVMASPGTIGETRLYIEKTLKEVSPHYLNPVSVLNEQIDNMYIDDRNLAKILIFATILAVLLTSLGQYSLSSYTTKRRMKEMAIRKVMGSYSSGILVILTREMTRLILFSLVLAWPVAYLLMTSWLQKFAFRTEIGISIFLLSLTISFAISMVSISYHVIRLSNVEPAEMIRQK